MSRLSWDAVGDRRFEAGLDRGVLYPQSGPGVPWNGLVGVNKTPSGADLSEYHIDGTKYYQDLSPEDYALSLEAFTYPDEFEHSQGNYIGENGLGFGMQPRRSFGLSYRTLIGDDVSLLDRGYKIHLVYNALATPSSTQHGTIEDSPDILTFSWNLTTVPVRIAGMRPTADVFIDSTRTHPLILKEVEDILYGTPSADPRLPLPDELIDRFGTGLLRIEENQTTGMSPLVQAGIPDLKGHVSDGVYQATSTTRLTETGVPGLYELE